ncbi:MAG: EamA family transporter, partial [Rhizobacter sp.]|nr:EamA family transporter [Chlorobiales bacterium]
TEELRRRRLQQLHLHGLLYVAGAALLWSTGGVVIKSLTIDAFQTAFWRSLFAVITIVAIVRPQKISFDLITLLSSLCYAAMLILFVLATKLTTAANAILLQYTAPVYILILGHFLLGERVRPSQVLTVAVCLIGMAIFFLDDLSPQGNLGNLAAVLSGLGFGLFTVLLRKKRDDHPIDAIVIGNVWVIVICAGISIYNAVGAATYDSPASSPNVLYGFAISTADSVMVAGLGILQIGIPYILLTRGIKFLPALEASLVGMLEPILNPLWVLLIVGEVPSVNALTGGAIIVVAVTLQSIIANRVKPKTAPDDAPVIPQS